MASFNTMRSASAATPLIAQYACEICRERKVRCDRALPKCRRCDRLNQQCNYNQAHQRRTRDEQLRQLQERLAKTEAQLALNTPAPPPPIPSQPSSEDTEPALSTKWTRTPDFFTPSTCSQQNSQYQLPETTNPQSQPASTLGNTVTHTSMDLDNIKEMSTASDMANGSSFLDPDLFTSFTDVADSNITFAWTNQPLMALEPLDHVLLNRPHSAPQSSSKDELSPTDLNLLHDHFFESVYFSFPFVNRDRFVAESTENNNPATNALIYAVALAGCAHSPQNVARQSTCYTLSRNYAEKCEQDNHLNHLNFLQALLLIGRFEAMNRKLERSWLTLGRAAMLCKLLELQRMDEAEHCQGSQNEEAQGGLQLVLPHTDNPVLLEERRRTFWGLYILQSYVRTRTGWPCQLGDTQSFRINLPSPGLLRSNLEPIKMPSLLDFSTENSSEISSYAGCVLMVELALCCFDNGQQRDTAGFWDNYCGLVKKTDNLFNILKHHLNATSIREDPVAFSLYLNLRAIEIFSHESAIIKSEDQGLPPLMIAGSQSRATAAAFQICSAVGLNLPSPRKKERDIIMLQAIFIAWPLTMALKALYRELVKGGIRETVNGVVASSRLLFAALDHIEESDGYWHQSVTHVGARLQEWDEKNSFEFIAL